MPVFLFGLFLPRVLFIILYMFTEWFAGVFGAWYWLLAGFIFMPYSTLWYSAVINWYGGAWTPLQTSIMAFALITDVVTIIHRRKS